MRFWIFLLVAGLSAPALYAQDGLVYQTFKDRRVINSQSVETLPKRKLDVRITHRFGDIGGANGGYETLFGLDNAADILIGAEYGITDDLNIGLNRTKAAGIMPDGTSGLRQLLNGSLKYRIFHQREDNSVPVSLTTVGLLSMSMAKRRSENELALNSFPKFAHRFAYNLQLLVARRFSPGFSLQLMAGYTHRNLVPNGDSNGLFSLGMATRLQISKVFGIIADANYPLSSSRLRTDGFYVPFGIGLEIEAGGHVFQVNFTNTTGIVETDYLPYTTSSWLDGQFRLGFTISRMFNL